jgi:hypothetical protein
MNPVPDLLLIRKSGRTTGKIIVLCIIIFKFFDSGLLGTKIIKLHLLHLDSLKMVSEYG